jgi:hypothetical protein
LYLAGEQKELAEKKKGYDGDAGDDDDDDDDDDSNESEDEYALF